MSPGSMSFIRKTDSMLRKGNIAKPGTHRFFRSPGNNSSNDPHEEYLMLRLRKREE